jgi:carnitine O-acetyltransferase
LSPDASVVLNLNPFFVLEDSPDPKIAKDQIRRAASLCFASVKMASQLSNEMLKPDTFKGKPLCMDQFRALFGSARVPNQSDRDDIDVYPDSSHVAVLCKNQMYYFQALWPDGSVAVDEEDIVDILEAVHQNAKVEPPTQTSRNSLGVLTSLRRSEWAHAREELARASSKNEEYLAIVDSALFVLVLDDYIPPNLNAMAANMLHGSYKIETDKNYVSYQVGSCCNRWYDKLQIIVCGDGTAGINFEHSAIDGHTALRFVSDIYAETVVNFAQSITKTVHAHGDIPNVINAEIKRSALNTNDYGRPGLDVFPKKIAFSIPDNVKGQIYFAETALGDQILASDTVVLEFKDFGKLMIVSNNLSPDAFVQMSMMLAYYKLYGKIVCAYEPVLTKSFYHGRTEAMRPATSEAKALCEIMFSPNAADGQKSSALRRAIQAHSQFVKECARGMGVDRHLFALKCIAERHDLPIPSFFQSEPWKMLNHTILSTSNCGNPSLRLFGFGPVVPDGLGIGYIIKDNSIHYSISSKHRQNKRYAFALEGVLKDLASLLERSTAAPVRGFRRTSLKELPVLHQDVFGDMWGENSGVSPSLSIDRWALDKETNEAGYRWVAPPEEPSSSRADKAPPKISRAAPARVENVVGSDSAPHFPSRRASTKLQHRRQRPSLTPRRLSESGMALDLLDLTEVDDEGGGEESEIFSMRRDDSLM